MKGRVVIKIGSNILTSSGDGLDLERIRSLADDISALHDEGYDPVVVSSGAIASGMKNLGLKRKPQDIVLKQAAAAVGQSSLMWAYEKCFSIHGKKVAQILLTREDLSDRKRYINSRNTLNTLISFRIIPIINENDTVAPDEIRFGDNDHLASLVATLIEAERFVILSDVDGLFTGDPRKAPNATLIDRVWEITPEIEGMAGGSVTAVGTGGMYSKILAAKRAMNSGIPVNIVNGRKKGILKAILKGERFGTEFIAREVKPSQKKRWIAHGVRPKGFLSLDNGAVEAIVKRGKSLLPSGIVDVSGHFDTGDAVYCLDTSGNRIAKGLVNYSSEEILRIKGRNTREIDSILGYKYSDEVIHRDNLAIL